MGKPTKNIVFIAQSIDGYIADKNGGLEWLNEIPNPDGIDMGFYALLEEIDAIVMGRKTYETVAAFGGDWPYTKPVFVLSKTLSSIPENLENKVSLIDGDVKTELQKLNAQGFNALYIDGGTTIQGLLKEGLIDELRITTIPILLGGGAKLFGDLLEPQRWDHFKTEVFLQQVVQSCYTKKMD